MRAQGHERDQLAVIDVHGECTLRRYGNEGGFAKFIERRDLARQRRAGLGQIGQGEIGHGHKTTTKRAGAVRPRPMTMMPLGRQDFFFFFFSGAAGAGVPAGAAAGAGAAAAV